MPNRILKESICTSETIEQLSWEEEAFFYRLITVCDDYGRFDARPRIIRGRCFPLRLDLVSDAQVEEWLAGLEEAGLLRLYVVDGHPYLQIVTWERHQQIRAKTSKYPPMPADACEQNQAQAGDSSCCHVQADDSGCSHMSSYSNSVLENRESVLEVRGAEGCGEPSPTSPSPPDATPTELALLRELKAIKGYPFDYERDLDYVRNLLVDFADLDVADEVKKWSTYKRDRPLQRNSNPRLQFRNWLTKAREFASERRARNGRSGGPSGPPARKSNIDELVIRDADLPMP